MANSTDPKQAAPDPAKPSGTPPDKGPPPDGNVKPSQNQKIVAGAVSGAVIGAAIGAAVAALSGDD